MLEFIIYTLVLWFAGNGVLKIFFQMIQEGEALDILFGWQKMLRKLYGGNKVQQLIGKALGDCEKCVSFWFMPIWFACYYCFMNIIPEIWITDKIEPFWLKCFVNVFWYLVFHTVGARTGLRALLFNKEG